MGERELKIDPEQEKQILDWMSELVLNSRESELPAAYVDAARQDVIAQGLMSEAMFDSLLYQAEDVVNTELFEVTQITEGEMHDQAD